MAFKQWFKVISTFHQENTYYTVLRYLTILYYISVGSTYSLLHYIY